MAKKEYDSLKEDRKRISDNETSIAVLYERVESINQMLVKMETNHLPHISEEMDKLEKRFTTFAIKLRKEIGRMDKRYAAQSPIIKLGFRAVEVIIIAVVMAVLVLSGIGR